MSRTSILFALIVSLSAAASTHADVRLPEIFGNHMVLQQDGTIPVWGWAAPGEGVKVAMGDLHAETTAGADGKWRLDLPAMKTNDQPQKMTVVGKNTIVFEDVLVGEVWLASGQSNMAFAMGWVPKAKEIAAATVKPTMRRFEVEGHPGIRPKTIGKGHWTILTPETAQNGSAVAYFFAVDLQQKLNRPIGLIESYWGGTPIETWMSKESLQPFPDKAAALAQVEKEEAAFPKDEAEQRKTMDDYIRRATAWDHEVNQPWQAAMKKWHDENDAARAAGKPVPPEPQNPWGTHPKSPDGQEGDVTTLYNGMISWVIPYRLRGALWYQGEANTGQSQPVYAALLKGMITDWRQRWGEGDFPFLIVGLANIDERKPVPTDNGWAEVRGAQAELANTMPNVGLAEAIDLGTWHNIHPYDKVDVGKRLAASAQKIAYGQDVVGSGPVFDGMKVEGSKVRIRFKSVGSGLKLGVSPFVSNEPPNDNPAVATNEPLGFEVAGADQKWVNAKGQLEGNEVVIWSDQVPQPVAVRYLWSQNPPVNLYNKEGFPAVPFRTESWPAEKR